MKKIFGIGLSRTGTSSLTYALKQVGFNIIHYPNSELELFNPQSDGACDIPVAVHYKTLDEKFPNSKFVYTVRKKEDWLISAENHFQNRRISKLPEWHKQNRIMIFGQLEFDKDVFAAKYDAHNEDVRTYFKGREQDLLILNICAGDKLEKLFSFIGVFSKNAFEKFPNKNKLKTR